MRSQRDRGRRRRGLLGALLGAVVALGLVASPASAEYVEVGTVGDDTTLNSPTGVAVDESTKAVYVSSLYGAGAPPGFNTGIAVKYDATGEAVDGLRANHMVGGVTLNQTSGNVYILDNGGVFTPTISIFDRGGIQVGESVALEGVAGFVSQPALDSSGNLYVSRGEGVGVQKFDATGTNLLTTITGSGENEIYQANSVAVDGAGNLYTTDKVEVYAGPEGEEEFIEEYFRVQKFNSAGVFQEVITEEETTMMVAVNPVTGEVFVSKGLNEDSRIVRYDSNGEEIDEFGLGSFAESGQSTVPRVTIDVSTGRVYAIDGGANTVRVFAEINPPVATTGSASAVTQTTATLEGELNPGGGETECLFLYGEEGDPLEEEAPCDIDPVEGSETVDVSADITGLDPNTEYEFQLTAENSAGPDEGDVESFTTLPPAPVATTGSAGGVTQTAATLNATVNANGNDASCLFQYGTSSGYGSTIPCSSNPVTGSSATAVSAGLSGLTPGTTYHFRVVAENDGGKVNGVNQTFTTAAHTCESDASLCPPPPAPPAPAPPAAAPPAPPATKPKPKPLKCKKGFAKKKVKGKQKCVKQKKNKGKKKGKSKRK